LNYKKKETKIPKFNLIKKINPNLETFELIDSDISNFSTIFRNCGAVYVKVRFVFKTLKALKAIFDGLLANFLNNNEEGFYIALRSIEEGFYDDIPAHSNFDKSSTIRFDITGDSLHFLNLSETEIHIKGYFCSLADPNTGILETKKIGIANNLLGSLFSSAEISFNNKPVENTNSLMHYRDYIYKTLGLSAQEKNSQKRNVISPSVREAISLTSEISPFKYPLSRVVIKPVVISYASTKFTIRNLCDGILPKRIILGFLQTSAFDGAYAEDPYDFKNIGLLSLLLKVNSKSLPVTEGLKLDYDKNTFLDGFRSISKLNKDLDLSLEEHKSNFCFYAFDLNPDSGSCNHYSPLKDGQIDLDVTLKASLTASHTLIAVLEYSISKTRQANFVYLV
jgi:hypothetical protein